MNTFNGLYNSLFLSLGSFFHLITSLCLLLGTLVMMFGLSRYRILGDKRAMSPPAIAPWIPFMYVLGGAMLMFIPSFIHSANATFFMSSSLQALSYNHVTGRNGQPMHSLSYIIGTLVQLAGYIAFIRGIFHLVGHTNQQNEGRNLVKRSVYYMLGGIFAINVAATHSILYSVVMHLT